MEARGARFRVVEAEWAAYRLHGTGKTQNDPADRKGELAVILGEQFGLRSPQYLWLRMVFRGYQAAELLGSGRALKRGIRKANSAMLRLTRNRIGAP